MDEKEIKQNIDLFADTLPFMSFHQKIMVVSIIQSSVEDWNSAVIAEYARVKDEKALRKEK